MKVTYDEPLPIIRDNTSVISMSKNLFLHSKTKHILMKYHFFRVKVVDQIVRLKYIETSEQIVDIFTKPLTREPFEYLRE